MEKQARFIARIVLMLLGMALAAACASSQGVAPAAGGTVTPTPDPLYSIHCPRQTKNTYLCYPGEKLLGDNALLEKAASDYCLAKIGRCSLFIWKDEASVGQTYPLTEAETKSLVATYLWNWVTYDACFKALEEGETVYSSGNCPK